MLMHPLAVQLPKMNTRASTSQPPSVQPSHQEIGAAHVASRPRERSMHVGDGVQASLAMGNPVNERLVRGQVLNIHGQGFSSRPRTNSATDDVCTCKT